MTDLAPTAPATPPPPKPPRSLWKPIGLTLAGTFLLGFSTCSALLLNGNFNSGSGEFLLYLTWFFYGVFALALLFALGYGVTTMIRKLRSR